MIKEIRLPEVAENVESGTVVKVLVSVGDVIEIRGGYTRTFNNVLALNLSRAGSYSKSSQEVHENRSNNLSLPRSG